MFVTFDKVSFVPAPCKEVWHRVTTPEGINHELMPAMRMTVPRPLKGKGIDDVPLGQKIGRSWFLLFGLLPFGYDDITIVDREPSRRFLEKSKIFSMARWEHERTLTERAGGCEVRDRVTFQLRRPLAFVPGAHRLLARFLRWLFAHRHRRLVRSFPRASR